MDRTSQWKSPREMFNHFVSIATYYSVNMVVAGSHAWMALLITSHVYYLEFMFDNLSVQKSCTEIAKNASQVSHKQYGPGDI